jgi:protein-tyrosine-phosphatase/tRNA A37 threonylcarbamoyladenosine synthetase subunit TsaC/SUA5/YrdC
MSTPTDIPLPRPATTIKGAVDALRAGRLVIIPTETYYGIAANAANSAAVALLRDLITVNIGTPREPSPHTWHAPDFSRVYRTLGDIPALLARAGQRLTPGPVRLTFSLSPEHSREVHTKLGVPAGVLERDGVWTLRIPSDPSARDVLAACPFPIAVERISSVGLGEGVRLPAHVMERAASWGIGAVLNTGPTIYCNASTQVVVESGSYRVTHAGAVDARQIAHAMTSAVLFVCTGNTCRSPMAAAIAADLLEKRGVLPTSVQSAGLAAGTGAPMTPEARQALTEMGVPVPAHRSKDVDVPMVKEAEHVFAMTRSHQRALQASLSPDQASKVLLLDPNGKDIADPIGGPLSEYRSTAQAISEAVLARLLHAGLLAEQPIVQR